MQDDIKKLRKAYDELFDKFVDTRDVKIYEAAKAIAIKILILEERWSAYTQHDLRKMYTKEGWV